MGWLGFFAVIGTPPLLCDAFQLQCNMEEPNGSIQMAAKSPKKRNPNISRRAPRNTGVGVEKATSPQNVGALRAMLGNPQ